MKINKVSITNLCEFFKKTRPAYYSKIESDRTEKFQEELVLNLVIEIRKILPEIGVRKLYYILKPDFNGLNFKLGRDKLFSILRNNSLLLYKKRKFVRTTNSNHWYFKYKNLIKNLVINKANQVIVSDITYLRVDDHFMYLSLITDYFSRKIIGYCLHENLSAEGPIKALKMALRTIKNRKGTIHHSDRGIQYACTDYTKILNKNKIQISMTEENHVYENALAERVNGILKTEFYLNQTFKSEKQAIYAVKEAVEKYNTIRPHFSIGLLTPEQKYAA